MDIVIHKYFRNNKKERRREAADREVLSFFLFIILRIEGFSERNIPIYKRLPQNYIEL